jgi:hypothetical protein
MMMLLCAAFNVTRKRTNQTKNPKKPYGTALSGLSRNQPVFNIAIVIALESFAV